MADRRITIQINADGTAAIRNIRDVTDETRRFGDTADSAGRRAADALRGIAAAIGGAAVARAFLDANIAADRLEASLTAVTGSTSVAGRELAYITDVANRLGLEVSSAANAYVSLSAASKGTTLEGAQARAIFEAVSLAMAKLGKSSADTEGALLAIEQMISKGKVSAEELRGQLGERLPGAFAAAAAAMEMTTAELDALLVSGGLTADELLPKLAARLNALYDDGSEISGLTAEWNRMTTAFQGLAVAIDDAAGITYGLEAALRHTAEFIDDIRWAIEYMQKGVNPDRLAPALSAGDFGYENLRAEADRLYSDILAKQTEIYTLTEKIRESEQSRLGRSVTPYLNNDLIRAQGELLEYAQRLGDIKTAIAEMDQAQDQAWARQADAIAKTTDAMAGLDAATQTYVERAANLLTRQGDSASRVAGELAKIIPVVDEMSKKYGVAREVILGVIAQESGFREMAKSAKGALGYMQIMPDTAREIEGALGMAAGTIDKSWNANIEAGTFYLDKMIEKFGSLEKALHAYNAGPGAAGKGILPEETRKYIPAVIGNIERLIPLLGKGSDALKLFEKSGTKAGKKVKESMDPAAKAMKDAVDSAERLARQHLDGYEAAQDYAEAQRVLAVAVAEGAKTQEQATAILDRMREEQAKASASAWQNAWIDAVQIVDDAFGNLWLDLFEGTSDALATMKRAIIQWLAQVAHMLTTQRLTLAIGASIGLPGYASAAGTTAGTSGGGMGLGGMLSGLGGWFGSSSIGTSLGIGMGQSSLFNWVPTSGLTNLMATSNLAMFGGFGGGMLAGTLLGNGSQASQMGTMIGSAAGSVIGSMIFPVVGTVIGGVLGGGGGGLLGKLFGGKKEDKPNPWAAIDVAGGQLRLLGSNEMDSGAIRQALDQVNREMDAVAQALGQAAVDWRRFYNHTSWHLTSGESIDSMIQNMVQWQITHMIGAMKSDELARAGSVLMAEMISQMASEAGSDPAAAVAAVKMAKAMHRQLAEAVERLFVFSGDAALFSSVDQASQSLWDLAQGMRAAGESAADALNRIMAAVSNMTITSRLNPGLDRLTLDQAALDRLTAERFGELDRNVAAAQEELARALQGNLQDVTRQVARRVWETFGSSGDDGWSGGGGAWRIEYVDVVTQQRVVDQRMVEAARQRLEQAKKLAEITKRVLTEEEIQAELMRMRIEIMDRITELAGGAESLAALQTQYYEMAFTEQERAQQAVEYALGKLSDFNSSIGRSGAGAINSILDLRRYVEALDLSTEAGQAAYVQGLKQVEYFALLEDALETLNPELENLDQNLRGTLDTIRNALRASAQTMGVSEFERAMALRDLTRMASSSALPAQADLERTLGILNRVTDQDFRSAADRDLSRARTYASLLKLESIGERQIDPAAAAVTAMMDASAEQHTESLEEMQRQTAVLEQLNASLQSVPVDSRAAQSDQLVAELRALRADLATLTAQQILPARDTRDILRRWELDGLPSPRDESSETVGLLRVA